MPGYCLARGGQEHQLDHNGRMCHGYERTVGSVWRKCDESMTSVRAHVHRHSWAGQAHHHSGALADCAHHGDVPAVLLHDHPGPGQANACPRDAPRRGGPVERREDVRQLVVRDAHAAIAHGDDGPLVVPAHCDVHRCARKTVPDSVTDDVLHHALQVQTVALDHHVVARVHHHRCGPLGSAGVHAADHVADQGTHVDGLHAQVQLLTHLQAGCVCDLL